MERVLEEYSRDPTRLREIAKNASDIIRSEYSHEAERKSIVRCWEAIVA